MDYLPYQDAGDDTRAKRVTARHVLSHRTGLENYREKPEVRFLFTPGERFGYSGEGFVWLQRVMEHIAATPFARKLPAAYTRVTTAFVTP